MSWLDRVNTGMTITCGDGSTFTPAWFDSKKKVDYNITEFEFVGISGAFVDRRLPKARRFNFRIVFQGEDNIEQSNAFEESAKDRRAWVISHPLYDSITVHPTGLSFDDTKFNASEITGTLVETLSRTYPQTEDSPIDVIIEKSDSTAESNLSFSDNSVSISGDISEANNAAYNEIKEQVPTEDKESYFNKLNEANSKLSEATTNASVKLQSLIDTQEYLLAPAFFIVGLRTRINILTNQLNSIINLLPNSLDKSNKLLFEYQGSAILNAAALSVSKPLEGDLENANETLAVAEVLQSLYNTYITQLDAFQTENNTLTTDYSPDQELLQSLNSLVNYSIGNLLNIALEGKQEREFLLYSDSNIIELTHRLYGLDEEDLNIQKLIKQNDWGINMYLQVPANTLVKYYV